VACLDCRANAHTNAATHLVGDIRPQEFRHRIDTPSLRGVNIQRLFGSQRALKSVEDFTEFEQRAAYFDGDPVIAIKKGVNVLERGSQVHDMAEFQELLDFPPAPKLDVMGSSIRKRPRRPSSADRPSSSARETAQSATRRPTTPTISCTTSAPSASSSR
jgi:cytochrome c peroxidase